MDYVYVCRRGDNEELRYSIRSLVKNLPDVNVWVIGDAPSWYTGNIVRVKYFREKYLTVRHNLKVLSQTSEINEDFVLMNDDFFVMHPMDSVQVWHGGSLRDKHRLRSQTQPYSPYTQYLLETYKTVKDSGIEEPLDYELHTPLPTTKSSIAEAIKLPGLWRSITGNQNGIGGEQHDDVKLYHPTSQMYRDREDLDSSPYLSCDDDSFGTLLTKYLMDAFPDPSPYEAIDADA